MAVDPLTLPYRPCVGVMVLNREGLVWTGRRISEGNTEAGGKPQLWQMPQGGIDRDEEAEPAARRELFEETGMESVELLEGTDDWLTYDLPAPLLGVGLRGKYRGQMQRWFAYRFNGDDREIRIQPPPDGHSPEFDDWAWREMEALPALVVDFKRDLYERVVARFRHLAGTRA